MAADVAAYAGCFVAPAGGRMALVVGAVVSIAAVAGGTVPDVPVGPAPGGVGVGFGGFCVGDTADPVDGCGSPASVEGGCEQPALPTTSRRQPATPIHVRSTRRR